MKGDLAFHVLRRGKTKIGETDFFSSVVLRLDNTVDDRAFWEMQ